MDGPKDAEAVNELHDFAKGLYTAAVQRAETVEALITTGVPIPKDVADGGPVEVTQPVLAWAILNRVRQMLPMGNPRVRVMPQKAGEKEQEICSRNERFLNGFYRQVRYLSKRDPDRDAAYWYTMRGVCRLETIFRDDWLGTKRVPVEILTDDPNWIFPVRGRGGDTLWYTKETTQYALELRRTVRDLQERGKPVSDAAFLFDEEKIGPNDLLKVVEYRDGEYYRCVVEDENLIIATTPAYGFVPLAEGRCLDTPMESAEWAYQSVIGPVVEHIRQMYLLMSKLATGVDLFFYPLLYGVSATGEVVIVDPNQPGRVTQMLAPGTELRVVQIQVNAPMLAQLMQLFKNDINLATIPETAWGAEPTSLESGFAIAQVLNQVQSAMWDKVPNLQRALGDTRGNVLWLVEKFGGASGSDLSVPVDYQE